MPQFKPAPEERVVTEEQYGQGYLVRDGMVVQMRPYELIRKLPDGTYLVRAPDTTKKQ
jgi:hypothetical protein